MKYICITKYIHCLTLNKYTKSFLITKLTIDHWCHQPGCHHSEPQLGRSKESNNPGIKEQVKRTFKSYFFCHEKKKRQALLEIFPNPEY